MTSSNILRTRKDVRYVSTIDPTTSDGLVIGEMWQNSTSGEIFTLTSGLTPPFTWKGTQGTVVT